ncbi:MAG: tyrosine-type recombinase/integrase [Gemmataceae bacterium]|nr:tyrosine-type recombinase/integrase [Gemmataceae bacterium]
MLRDLTAERIDDYLTRMTQASRTVGKHRSTVHVFAAWLAGKKRLPANPLTHTLKPKDTPARQPRAFTAEELGRLLVAARERSLAEAGVNKGGRTRKDGTRPAASVVKLSEEARAERIRSGRERELVYRMSALTGLRRGELGALVVCDLSMTDNPIVRIPAFDPYTRERLVKNGQAVVLPLVPTLAADLAAWVADTGKNPGDRVFDVPALKTFKADMRHAGIPYKDARGRTADFHSLRRSTATMLALAGISPKEAQVFMRHSDIRLTLQTYTDAAIIGTANAAAALANFRL